MGDNGTPAHVPIRSTGRAADTETAPLLREPRGRCFPIQGENDVTTYETEAGTGPEHANGFRPDDDKPSITIITGAPDIREFLKPKRTAEQKEYEERAASMLKALLIGSLNSGQAHDAAAIIRFGPGFARATGHLASSSDTARKLIDTATAPGNPWAQFAMTGFPLVAQIFRNHEEAIRDIPRTRRAMKADKKMRKQTGEPKPPAKVSVKIPFTKIRIPVRFNVKWSAFLSGFRAQTQEPHTLTESVFSDPKVLRALVDLGITIYAPEDVPEG